MRYLIAALTALAVCFSSGSAVASSGKLGSSPTHLTATAAVTAKASKISNPNRNKPKRAIIPAYWVYRIIKCGGGGYLGYISSAGWKWYERAVSVTFGCILAV